MCFKAIQASYEAKEDLREKYDRDPADSLATRGDRVLHVGDIVSICKPTPTLRKVTYQWTEPQYVVVLVTTVTVTVRDLGNKGEAKLSVLNKVNQLKTSIVNRKMTRVCPVQAEFFVGATVTRRFSGRCRCRHSPSS